MTTAAILTPRYPPQGGGAAVYFEQVVNALEGTAWSPVVVTVDTPDAPEQADVYRPVPIPSDVSLASEPLVAVRTLAFGLRWLRRHQPDVLHVHPHFPRLRFWWPLLERTGIPVVFDCRDSDCHRRVDLGRGDAWLSTSPTIDGILVGEAGVNPDAIVRSPITLPSPLPPADARQRDGPFRVVFIGRLSHHKGVDIAMEAVAGLDGDRYRLTIIGDGPLRDVVHRKANGDRRVTYRGELPPDDCLGVLRESDLLVIPSAGETRYARSVLEALSMGLPVVATAVGDLPELIGDAGVIVDRDPNALREGIERVGHDARNYREAATHIDVPTGNAAVREAVIEAYARARESAATMSSRPPS